MVVLEQVIWSKAKQKPQILFSGDSGLATDNTYDKCFPSKYFEAPIRYFWSTKVSVWKIVTSCEKKTKNVENVENDQRKPIFTSTALCIFKED